MHIAKRRGLLVVPMLALLASTACSSPAPHEVAPPGAVGAGIQQNVSLGSLQTAGWSVCYEDRYGDYGSPVDVILAGCTGPYLMLACRADGTTDTLALAAADTRAVVTQADPAGATSFHASNGVGWYYTDTMSWGFFPASDTVNRGACDHDTGTQTNKDKRLCWNLDVDGLGLIPGYRCGDNALGSGSGVRRMVLKHP